MPLTSARFSPASSQRVRETLIEAILREIPVCRPSSDHALPALPGVWNLLVQEGCTWQLQPRLDRRLFADLRGHFGSNVTREILLAAAGVKISRTCLADPKVELLRAISERHGFAIAAGSERYIHRRDSGKGGSSNSIERVAAPQEEAGLRNVYIAPDAALARTGVMLEEAGDDENFGRLLGIPRCCREAYIRLSPVVSRVQNDFVVPTLDNTPGPMPYDFWLNYPANYFGPGLISFFPCSFRCPHAAAVAKSSFAMLQTCDDSWAAAFLENHRTNIIYTEHDGLHLFRRPLIRGCIEYGPGDHKSTEPGRLNDLIGKGSRLQVRGRHNVVICRQSDWVGAIEGSDVGVCAFL